MSMYVCLYLCVCVCVSCMYVLCVFDCVACLVCVSVGCVSVGCVSCLWHSSEACLSAFLLGGFPFAVLVLPCRAFPLVLLNR